MTVARGIWRRSGEVSALRVGHRACAAVVSLAARCVRRVAFAAKGGSERGMSTAEYAMGTLAACGFAALLYKVVTGTEIQEALMSLINKALSSAG
ncbi:DUF4244 domain-containing protein [Spongiactinospora rosea]|uniref:DUF4244 domain-containing protein n=2 Tax=Spongiactinospora rosea TaxID=2248750 RepID=A0A366M9K9_9ACTN|nr:DUF4244 domain-containing protein [Spongiactinospora rosea]